MAKRLQYDTFSITAEAPALMKQLEQFPAEKARKMLMRTVNDTLAKTKTAISKSIREKYTIKAADLKESIITNKASTVNLRATIRLRSGPLTTVHFSANALKSGVSVSIKKGKRVKLKHAFMRSFRGGPVIAYHRKNNQVYSIRTVSIPQMLNDTTFPPVNQVISNTYTDRLEHYIKRELEGNA